MAAGGRSGAKTAVLAALAKGSTVADAAAAGKVGERTVYRWKSAPEFQDEISRLRAEMLDRAAGSLSDATEEAVATLRRALRAKDVAVRVRAAREILSHTLVVRDSVEFEARIRKLEEQNAGRDAP